MRKALATSALAAVLAVAGTGLAPSAAATVEPARIAIIGDSVTQGKVGDLTWRYRLWRTLQAQGRYVDLVGPHTGLYNPVTTSVDSPGYADPGFDQDHAAWWGLAQTQLETRLGVEDLMVTYAPDVVINVLGVNDLLFVATPSQLVEGMRQFVIDVRAVDAHVTVVIGQLTQTWFTNQGAPVVEQYNQMLSALAASLDQPDARVIAAARPADYTVGADTYDGSHPDASGEIKIAHQFASVLSTLALPDRPAPTTYGGAATLSAAPRFGAARLTFTTPPGATRQAIWKRNVTRNGRWRLVGYVDASVHRYRVPSLRHHHRYAFRLRAYQGNLASTTFSNRVRVRIL